MSNMIGNAIETIVREARRPTQRLRDERGMAVPLVAIVMTVLVWMTGVGIDTGRVATVATETQNAADVAALAGARALADEEDPNSRANLLLQQNQINGLGASPFLQSLTVGNFDADRNFIANAAPTNAVRAFVVNQMDTVVLRGVGKANATVNREAIATLGGIGSTLPTLPIVIGECNFISTCYEQACMPSLSQAPNTANNSAWTGFSSGATNGNIHNLMPAPVGNGNSSVLGVGEYINLMNGAPTQFLRDVQRLLDDGQTTFVIPIVDCGGSSNQTKQVRGFAKIMIDQIVQVGNPKGIWLHALYGGAAGTPGGGNFGVNVISLAK